LDFAINWESLGRSSTRMRHVSVAMADLALEYGEIDVVVGIAISGIPFATLMADEMVSKLKKDISLAVFHPIKHRKGKDARGAISSNFAKVKNKRVLIVDDVITSGRTIKEAVTVLKGQKATPVVVAVLIDKKGISKVDGVPVTSLIKVKRLG
ncbi:MAG: orotate phosphoribosyltransferase-like protein, partial [Methanobacteriales archaeon]|nr:orotate phosphoribosyltransferase-like protein [Methanobacteriales archaeon]